MPKDDLLLAIQDGNDGAVEHFFKHHDIDVNKVLDRRGYTYLHHAAKGFFHKEEYYTLTDPVQIDQLEQNYLRIMMRLLKKGASLHARTIFQETPLLLAIEYSRDIVMINFLVQQGASFADRNEKGDTVLHLAAGSIKNNYELLKWLLSLNVQPKLSAFANTENNDGQTPMHYVVAKNSFPRQVESLQLLLDNNADPNVKDNALQTPLFLATWHGNKDCVRRLLPSRVINERDLYGNTALHKAASLGDLAIVKLLLSYNANPMLRNTTRDTPRLIALRNDQTNYQNCAELLSVYESQAAAQQKVPDEKLYKELEEFIARRVNLLKAFQYLSKSPIFNPKIQVLYDRYSVMFNCIMGNATDFKEIQISEDQVLKDIKEAIDRIKFYGKEKQWIETQVKNKECKAGPMEEKYKQVKMLLAFYEQILKCCYDIPQARLYSDRFLYIVTNKFKQIEANIQQEVDKDSGQSLLKIYENQSPVLYKLDAPLPASNTSFFGQLSRFIWPRAASSSPSSALNESTSSPEQSDLSSGHSASAQIEGKQFDRNDVQVKQLILKYQPAEYYLGETGNQGDSFFYAFAQLFNQISATNIYSAKSLRVLCYDFYTEHHDLVESWINEYANETSRKKDYFLVQYTNLECGEIFHNKGSISGDFKIEGRMLCQQLEINEICVMELYENQDKILAEQFYIITKDIIKKIKPEDAAKYMQKAQIPTVIVGQNEINYVPLLRGSVLASDQNCSVYSSALSPLSSGAEYSNAIASLYCHTALSVPPPTMQEDELISTISDLSPLPLQTVKGLPPSLIDNTALRHPDSAAYESINFQDETKNLINDVQKGEEWRKPAAEPLLRGTSTEMFSAAAAKSDDIFRVDASLERKIKSVIAPENISQINERIIPALKILNEVVADQTAYESAIDEVRRLLKDLSQPASGLAATLSRALGERAVRVRNPSAYADDEIAWDDEDQKIAPVHPQSASSVDPVAQKIEEVIAEIRRLYPCTALASAFVL